MRNDNRKEILWSILEKYDACGNHRKLCDSISNIIQNKHNSVDLINIYISFVKLDNQDIITINNTIGSEIDTCLFSY